jgi:hypothetical protein
MARRPDPWSTTCLLATTAAIVDEHARKQHLFLATSRVHGYVLMSNHFHLLATPETEGGHPADDAGGRAALRAQLQPAAAAPARCGKGATGRR